MQLNDLLCTLLITHSCHTLNKSFPFLLPPTQTTISFSFIQTKLQIPISLKERKRQALQLSLEAVATWLKALLKATVLMQVGQQRELKHDKKCRCAC